MRYQVGVILQSFPLGQIVSIVVKNDRRNIQLVVVFSVSHSESQILQTNVRNDTQPRYAITGLEILRLQRKREIVVFNPILGTTNSVCGELCIGPLSFVLYYAARRSK